MSEIFNVRKIESDFLNYNACAKCGGKCCINIPCAYFPTDFITFDIATIQKVIEKYNAVICEVEESGVYLLRARGVLDDKKSILSKSSQSGNKCIFCAENGCILSENERPGWGLYSKPEIIANTDNEFKRGRCHVPEEILRNNFWADAKIQGVLKDIINDIGD